MHYILFFDIRVYMLWFDCLFGLISPRWTIDAIFAHCTPLANDDRGMTGGWARGEAGRLYLR